MDLANAADQRVKIKENLKKWTNRRTFAEEFVEQEGKSDTIHSWNPQNSPQELGKETGSTEDQRKNQNHPNHNSAKNSLKI